MKKLEEVLILAIESSCDETSVALVDGRGEIRKQIISSHVEENKIFGGVVPEVSSRAHEQILLPATQSVLEGIDLGEIDAVSVCVGPGLMGPLVVGVSWAKALALALDCPLIGVNHLEGHVVSAFEKSFDFSEPFVALVVSGGHTLLTKVDGVGQFKLMGTTLDDAVGEAFDKVARLMKLGYPGGPIIDRLAQDGDPSRFSFPRPMINSGDLKFSFSGLKTAVLYQVNQFSEVELDRNKAHISASFQSAVIDVLLKKSLQALREANVNLLAVGGGVAMNSELRKCFQKMSLDEGFRVLFPPPSLTGDNAGMIGMVASLKYKFKTFESLDVTPIPSLGLSSWKV